MSSSRTGGSVAVGSCANAREWELTVERARVWEAAAEHGGAQWRLAVGMLREWECIAVRAPSGKLRVCSGPGRGGAGGVPGAAIAVGTLWKDVPLFLPCCGGAAAPTTQYM
eukprot:XP_001702444.1 predicted protein [Chlamydomonas reinhardtii]